MHHLSFLFFLDVRQLQGERFGHMLDGPAADSVEERRKTVPPAQHGALPETGGEWRTLICGIFSLCLKPGQVEGRCWMLSANNLNLCLLIAVYIHL